MLLPSTKQFICVLPYTQILQMHCSNLWPQLAKTPIPWRSITLSVSTNKQFCTNKSRLTLSKESEKNTTPLKVNSYQNRADEQEDMLSDVYYNQLIFGAKIKNITASEDTNKSVTDNMTEHLIKDESESSTDPHIDELEGEEMDFSQDARVLMKAIKFVGPKAGLGLSSLLLIGSKVEKLWPRMKKSELYGSGKDKSKDYWMALAATLVANKYLEKMIKVGICTHVFHGYKVSRRGMKALREEDLVLKMRPTRELKLAIYKQNFPRSLDEM